MLVAEKSIILRKMSLYLFLYRFMPALFSSPFCKNYNSGVWGRNPKIIEDRYQSPEGDG